MESNNTLLNRDTPVADKDTRDFAARMGVKLRESHGAVTLVANNREHLTVVHGGADHTAARDQIKLLCSVYHTGVHHGIGA